MPAQVVAQALPFVNWILLVALAGGCFAFVALAGHATDATRGYLSFGAFLVALLAALALVADLSLPAPDPSLTFVPAAPAVDLARRLALGGFALAGLGYAVAVRRGRRRGPIGVLGLAMLALVVVAAAAGWAPGPADSVPLALQLTLLAGAAGGALATLVLGHWYLVTPRISTAPLVLLTRVLIGVLVVQLLTFAVWALFGGGPGQAAFDALTGSAALYGWLRVAVSIGFPLVLIVMAWRTALTRSMESATGLLYIAIAAISAGTIGAAVLYVTRGVLV